MNEKFFELKKEKQDRMINAALKVFSENGYKHASTDEIVSVAGISKGLLFHYFGSKLGLYTFLYDYCVRFMVLEIKTDVAAEQTDYFEIMKSLEYAKYQVYKQYPYLPNFVEASLREDLGQELEIVEEQRSKMEEIYAGMLEHVDASLFRPEVDILKLHTMIQHTMNGVMAEHLSLNSFMPDALHQECMELLDMMKKLAYV